MTLINTANKIYLGSTLVDKVYAGATQVWPAPSGAFLPTDISGLRTWLDASQLPQVAGAFTAWPNLGPDPSPTVIDNNMYLQLNELNGKSYARFLWQEGKLRGTTTVMKDYTVIFVVRCWVIGRVFSGRFPEGSDFLIGHHHSQGMDVMYAGGPVFVGTGQPLDNIWRMYTGDGASDGSYRLFVDGTMTGSTPTGNDGLNGYWHVSGYAVNGVAEAATFDLPELVMYNRRLTDVERGQVEGYLRTKWGL